MNNEERLIDIESAIALLQKTVEELNDVVISQGKEIDRLHKDQKVLLESLKSDNIKPLSEETPPPHY